MTENTLKARYEHWLRSKMRFSGRTSRESDRLDGALNLGFNGLFWKDHRAGVRYRDARTYRAGDQKKVLGFSYALPLGSNYFDLELKNTAYEEVSVTDGAQFQKEGRSRNLTLAGRRALFSLHGYRFLGRAHYTSTSKQWTRQRNEIHRTRYQLSTVGLEARGQHSLLGGFRLHSGLSAVTGIETESRGLSNQEREWRDDQFERFEINASVNREVLNWRWGLDGRYQFATAGLPDSQYLRVAGSRLMAGFNGQSLKVAEGGWLRLGSESPDFALPLFPRLLSSVRLSVLRGWVPDEPFQQHKAGFVTSGELSWGLTAHQFSADVSLGRVLNTTTSAIAVPDHPDVRVSMNLQI
ncbi:ShlB/FhaC/HecB family hemolysin secretion/activation protein [Marinobacter sp. VGCF2001]|uniref:ShlB/FhaC/HecB family hemolysin secretion/activation protein n=1 Tax=Marinobacter sp. VGCF2001 TaxID=3417189 RepID=UPI003CEA8C17